MALSGLSIAFGGHYLSYESCCYKTVRVLKITFALRKSKTKKKTLADLKRPDTR